MAKKKSRRLSPGDKKKNALKNSLKRGRQLNLGLGLFTAIIVGFVGVAYVTPRFMLADGATARAVLWFIIAVLALGLSFLTLKIPRIIGIGMALLVIGALLFDVLLMSAIFGNTGFGITYEIWPPVVYDNRAYMRIFNIMISVSAFIWIVNTIIAFWRASKAKELKKLINPEDQPGQGLQQAPGETSQWATLHMTENQPAPDTEASPTDMN